MSNRTPKAVLIANYGRSGQGWLGYMLCYVLNAAYVEPYDFLVGKHHTYSDHVRSLTAGQLPDRQPSGYSLVVKTHGLPSTSFTLTDKAIYLMRDPRDIAVSMHNLHLIRERQVGWAHPRAKLLLAIKKHLPIYDYLAVMRLALRHYAAWKHTPHYLATYENLLKDTPRELGRILDYLGAAAPEAVIGQAVEHFSFEKITGRSRGAEDKSNAEFRRGIAGDYKEKMKPWELALVNFFFGKTILSLGYQ